MDDNRTQLDRLSVSAMIRFDVYDSSELLSGRAARMIMLLSATFPQQTDHSNTIERMNNALFS